MMMMMMLLLMMMMMMMMMIIIIIITSDTSKNKSEYNYLTQYKASSLNLKIISSKRISFFVFLWCRIFIRPSHASRLPVRYSER